MSSSVLDLDLSQLSGKARMAVKRQIKYRTDEAYREKVKEKAAKSKQREEYKKHQKDYNKWYYQKMKEKLRQKRESKKNASFEDEADVKPTANSTVISFGSDYSITMEDNTVELEQAGHDEEYVETDTIDVIVDNEVVEEQEEEEAVAEDHVEEIVDEYETIEAPSIIIQFQPDQDTITETHSYPRPEPRVDGRKRTRGKPPAQVHQNVQVNFTGKRTQIGFSKAPKDVVRVVDVGTQVTDEDLDAIFGQPVFYEDAVGQE